MVTSPFKVGFGTFFEDFSNGEGTNVAYRSGAPNIAGSGEGSAFGSFYFATRTPSGWETIANRNGPSGSMFAPPLNIEGSVPVPAGPNYPTGPYSPIFSSDDQTQLVQMGVKGEGVGFYLRYADGHYARVGDHGAASEEMFRGASNDFSHIFFEGQEGPYTAYGHGIYEFTGLGNGQPNRVDLDNAGNPVSSCNFDGGGGNDSQVTQVGSVSEDGRVLVYTARACPPNGTIEANEIWARVGEQTSYDASASKCTRLAGDPGGACNAAADATFEGATPSGSRVFFSTTQQLVNGDTDQTRDLYACDIPPDEVAPVGLANPCSALTEVSNAATGAEVEYLLHTSADGSAAYFVAKGVLAANTDALGATPKAGDNNLYVWHQDAAHPAGQTTFIGALAENDLYPFGGGPQITPSGDTLVFTTRSRLVPTDNDTSRDVYRYDLGSGELTRVSTSVIGTGGNGELDARITSGGHGESGAVTDDGTKIVFTTSEALSPLDGNKAPDAYLWSEGEPEEGHVKGHVHLISTGAARGGSENVVVDSSGKDIYFETPGALVQADGDLQVDTYDARINGGFPNALPVCSVESEACQPPAPPAPAAEKAPSSTQPGPGNPPPPKTCSKGKVLKNGICVVKKPSKKKHGHKKKSHKRANSNGGGGK